MSYTIYKLKFPSGIHIGDVKYISLDSTSLTVSSDTFFSAIYAEYVRLFQDKELFELSNNGEFKVSDLFPFKNEELYLPKPFISIERKKEAETKHTVDRKKVKSLSYLTAHQLTDYLNFLRTGENFPQVDDDFGQKQLYTKNQISRTGEDTRLYSIEIFKFNEYSGLYFILKCKDEFTKKFNTVLNSLSYTGIGGKKSSGYGKFIIEKEKISLDKNTKSDIKSVQFIKSSLLYDDTVVEDNKKYMLLSSYAPQETEVDKIKNDNNTYNLIKRSGFVNSSSYSNEPQKRGQVYMLSSGSVLDFIPQGKLLDLNLHGNHEIYRLGKPIVMGVDLWEE